MLSVLHHSGLNRILECPFTSAISEWKALGLCVAFLLVSKPITNWGTSSDLLQPTDALRHCNDNADE